MKIERFILLFGILAVLLTACASAAQPTTAVSPILSPSAVDDVSTPPEGGSALGPMGGAAVHDLTPQAPVPTDNDTPITFPANTPILTWHREGGIAGFCDDVTVFANGAYTVASCKDTSAQTGQLTAAQLLQLTRLVNKDQSFENENNDPAVADRMSIKITFKGIGPLEASGEDMATINNFAALLVVQVAPVADGSAYPEAVSKARDFLAAELNIPADETKVVTVEAVEWSDRCLGVVIIGMMCAQGITPGYRVVLQAQGQLYELHTDESGEAIQQVMDK
jgi:hypothetical protein